MNKALFAALAAVAISFSSCNDDDNEVIDQKPKLLKGAEVKVAEGKAWTYLEKFAKSGYYPMKMTITKTVDGYQVELSEFIFRQQS